MSKFNDLDSLVQGLGRAYQGTEAGLLPVHRNKLDPMPFLPPSMTHMGTGGN